MVEALLHMVVVRVEQAHQDLTVMLELPIQVVEVVVVNMVAQVW
jgi:hypothetical protein